MKDVSFLIPARNEVYLEKTIRNILENIKGNSEVIAVLDGYLPDPPIKIEDDRVKFIHYEKSIGQRASINVAAKEAQGKFICKIDAHCAIDEGFDIKMMNDCEYDWTVIARMYNLDVETWLPKWHKRTDYMYFSSPSAEQPFRSQYYTGDEYKKLHRRKELIDDICSTMGPCWFLHKERFFEQGGCDEAHGSWGNQGIEVSLKAWLSGGSLKVNKKTWFAHWFRGGGGPGFPYPITGNDQERARKYSRDLWLNDKWPLAKRKLQWVIDKFNPPGWSNENSKSEKDGMTIIYYTSNYEKNNFEKNIINELIKNSKGIPIISVSQKPMDLGKNICVGDVGRSGLNILRQVQIGLKEATTKNVCVAESDFIYPEEYFKIVPPSEDTIFYINPLYILWAEKTASYFSKRRSEGAIVANRKHLLKTIDTILENKKQWSNTDERTKLYHNISKIDYIQIANPIVTFKTSQNLHSRSPYNKEDKKRDLPYWGNARDLIRRMNQ